MQSAISRDKMSALVLLAASTSFGVLAHSTGGVADDADTAPARLLIAFAVAGSLIALLMLLSPDKDQPSSRGAFLATFQRLVGLGALVLGYALFLETLGFLIATSLFLALGYLLLGERRWLPMLMTSVPVAVILEILIYGVFGMAIADPLLSILGFAA